LVIKACFKLLNEGTIMEKGGSSEMSVMQPRLFAPNLLSICIDSNGSGDYQGCVWQQYDSQPIIFEGMVDMILQMDKLFDLWGFPQAGLKTRSFVDEVSDIKHVNILDKSQKLKKIDVQEKTGKRGTFIVHVKFRQNASWQGEVVWREQNKRMHFRSVLELMKMIDSALESTCSEAENISTVS